ncbi:MAG: hypothetical protein CM15mP58_13500 [Burkholderiaceae bacterium]|nr:MAG: hypothetical protein CM15mP58_13500 [Burkholderiaceae bacterium]
MGKKIPLGSNNPELRADGNSQPIFWHTRCSWILCSLLKGEIQDHGGDVVTRSRFLSARHLADDSGDWAIEVSCGQSGEGKLPFLLTVL